MALRQLREAFKRKRHDEDLMAQCVDRVLSGESAKAISKETDIPYTTLMGRVNWRRKGYEPSRKRQQVQKSELLAPAQGENNATRSQLPDVDETEILQLMAKMQRAGLCVRRRDVLNKANELKGSDAAECSTQWFQRFRERHPEVSGSGTNLVLSETTIQLVLGVQVSDESVTQDPSAESGGQQEEAVEKEDQVQLTPSQRAVQVLQICYAQQLDAEAMVDAFDLMADPVLAQVFLVIAPGQLREMWLKQRIKKVRDAENDADAAAS